MNQENTREKADELRTICAEAYQVVGSLLSDLGKFGIPEGEKILDNLSQQRLVHSDVLPWPSFASPSSPSQEEVLVRARDALSSGFDGSAVRHGPNHSTIEIWYDTEAQAVAAHRVIMDLLQWKGSGMGDEQHGWLHIYAQPCEHFPAQIVGDRLGLETLRDAVQHALKFGDADSHSVFAEDGEGYQVAVRRVEVLSDQPMPYYSHHEGAEVANWRNRAFKAEAELSRLRRVTQTQEGK